jgi:hypothetical protein
MNHIIDLAKQRRSLQRTVINLHMSNRAKLQEVEAHPAWTDEAMALVSDADEIRATAKLLKSNIDRIEVELASIRRSR